MSLFHSLDNTFLNGRNKRNEVSKNKEIQGGIQSQEYALKPLQTIENGTFISLL